MGAITALHIGVETARRSANMEHAEKARACWRAAEDAVSDCDRTIESAVSALEQAQRRLDRAGRVVEGLKAQRSRLDKVRVDSLLAWSGHKDKKTHAQVTPLLDQQANLWPIEQAPVPVAPGAYKL